MAATFVAPFAGILVAIELLLFEFRARSFIPVAISSVVATAVAVHFRGWAPLFPTPAFSLVSMQELWLFALMGMVMGLIGIAMIRVLFFLEDAFDRFPFQPAAIWAPATGALILGLIGYFYPQVFGTGYDTIRDMLNDRLGTQALLGISIAKFVALVVSLGSGTTGGVFAPSLIVGGGVGAVYAQVWHHFLPHRVSDPALYSLVAMAAMFGGIARAVHVHRLPVRTQPQSQRAAAVGGLLHRVRRSRAAAQRGIDHDRQAHQARTDRAAGVFRSRAAARARPRGHA
jgi:H+/Cl- antiporter ClcA